MQALIWASATDEERRQALTRPPHRLDAGVVDIVQGIFADVQAEGAPAVKRWAQKIDGRPPALLQLSSPVVEAARALLGKDDLKAIEAAIDNVRFYHEAIKPKPVSVEMRPGVKATLDWRPIKTCGLYIPGGTAPLVSTLMMLAEPARVAGVPNRVLMTPPGREREAHPALIVAAAACGLEEMWLLGGAQAIAALTFGALTPRADKIFGPGNAYVSVAKRIAASIPGGPAIDLPAGPSELMVIADRTANAELIAADLLSQAEHDADAQVLLVSTSRELIDAVIFQLVQQQRTLRRCDVTVQSLAQARFIEVETIGETIEIANAYAPEHLSLRIEGASDHVASIATAGAIFVGSASAEVFGDYIAGPSHVLPTDGAGASWSGVMTASFMHSVTIQELSIAGAASLAPDASRLARLEGLEAHARAADLRATRSEPAPPSTIRRRRAEIGRRTKETDTRVVVDLDAKPTSEIVTGVPFYDHMLDQVAAHGGFALTVECSGDLSVDAHHTIEDCALALGQALSEALGTRRGIGRFGFVLPMDEAEAKVSIDLGGRPYLLFNGSFAQSMLGAYPTQMTEHVFRSLAQAMGASIHVSVTGENDHHKTEACFKALGRALRQAIRVESADVPSTKGVL